MKTSRIILITIDTLRADHLGCYGYGKDTSPNMDGLAGESVLFRYAFTPCTYTVPTHAAILTGRYPGNISTFFRQDEGVLETDREIMVQEILADEGFETAAFLGSFVLRRQWGLDAGFRVYDDEAAVPEVNRPESLYRHGEDTNERLFTWLGGNSGRDFFAWVHYFDVHGPYETAGPFSGFFKPGDYGPEPAPLKIVSEGERGGIPAYQAIGLEKDEHGGVLKYESDARVYLAGYDRGIRHADHAVGQLMDELKRLGVYDDATIIVTSDHGEALGEGGVYFFHGLTVTPEQTRVPLLIKLPGGRDGGTVIERPVSTIDIMPTVLSLSGVERGAVTMDGEPLFEPMEGSQRFILCENEWQRAVIAGEYYLVDEKDAARDGFTYYFDSKELCRGRQFLNYRTGRPLSGALDEVSAGMLRFSKLLSTHSDPKETAIRAKDSEIRGYKSRIDELLGLLKAKESSGAGMEREIRKLREQMAGMDENLQRILGSYSWSITRPLRWLSARVKGRS